MKVRGRFNAGLMGAKLVKASADLTRNEYRARRKAMTDEHELLGMAEGLKRIENMNRKRGHATCWHGERKFQGPMEVFATRCWSEEMDKLGHSIPICKIEENRDDKGNRDDPPDVLAEMDGNKIGVEVVELVDEKAIAKHPKIPPLRELVEPGPDALDKLPQPMPPEWPLEKFERRLRKRVQDKEGKVRKKHERDGKDNSLSKQFLLIVTCEPYLDEATLSEYLKIIKLQRPRHFDGIYVMMSYVPNPAGKGHGHYPLFEVPFAG